VEALPEPFQAFVHWNPVFFLIDGFRYGFIGHADGPLTVAAAVSVLFAAALSLLCWAVIRSGWRLKA
jgi:ABC-2 type transport system permease protein